MAARFLSGYLISFYRDCKKRKSKITFKERIILYFGGTIRGVLAFALISEYESENETGFL